MSLNDGERTAALEVARTLQSTLQSARLHILEARSQFDSKRFDDLEGWGAHLDNGVGAAKDPAVIAGDVTAQTSFLNKLKFQFLEQNAKDKYIKTIVSDDPQPVTAHDKEQLRMSNERKKQVLKAAKVKLAEKYQDIRGLAPFVEQDYHKAKTLTDEAASLSQKIVDARLALTRLRQAHPHPRMTISSAETQLEGQVMQMQVCDNELADLNDRVAEVKEKVKDGARALEALKVKRADVERDVKAGKVDVEDDRVPSLYEWYSASLAFMHSVTGLVSRHSSSENELRLTYMVEPASSSAREVTITLLFVPNTRQLADARLEGVDDDLGDIIDSHIQANDAPGLIASVLARARLK